MEFHHWHEKIQSEPDVAAFLYSYFRSFPKSNMPLLGKISVAKTHFVTIQLNFTFAFWFFGIDKIRRFCNVKYDKIDFLSFGDLSCYIMGTDNPGNRGTISTVGTYYNSLQ
jgi:hypothetical protein